MAGTKSNTFRAFNNRNYRLYFAGQSLSLIGTWMQQTAVSWVIYSITHSAFMLGLTMFAKQVPIFMLSLLGGIASDRYNRHKILLLTQILSMIQAVLLTLLIFTKHYVVWEILTLSAVLGTINAFDIPARQPLVHEMLNDPADVPNALALNSSMNNLARLIGPALAGIALLKFGAAACFLLNAISFLAVIISLLLMRLPAYIPATVKKRVVAELAEGFTYVKNTPAISTIMLMTMFTSLLVLPYNTMLPIFAKVVFNGNAVTFGYINSFIGLGAISGAIFLASLKKDADLKFVLLINTLLLGISLVVFSRIGSFPVAMVFAVIAGFGTMSQNTICNTIIQVNSDKAMRGRVMGILLLAIAMVPIGSLLTGVISQRIGAPATLFYQGIIAIIIAAIFAKFLSGERRNKRRKAKMNSPEETLIHQPS